MKMQVKLSQEEVEEIVQEHLQKKFKTVGKVKINVEEEYRGNFQGEYKVAVFKNAECEVEV